MSLTISLPAGKLLTLTADAFTSGSITKLSDSVGVEPSSPVAVVANSSPEFGAFAKDRRYEIVSNSGKIGVSITASSGKFDSDLTSTGDLSISGDTQDQTTITNIGTVPASITVVENGDGNNHTTTLTLAGVLPAITGGVDQAIGLLIYTFPDGAIVINHAYITVGITQSEGNINADTPEVGLGTVIGTGVVAVLSTTLEDILTGQVAANCTGTATVKTAIPTAAVPFIIETGDAHTLHFNAADGWAASGDLAATVAGTVIIDWSFIE